MKRRLLMVSAMILLLGSQVDMNAQKKGGPDNKRPGMEMRDDRKPGRPMNKKAISQGEIKRVQDYYWKKYRVKLSKKEAERILMEEMRDGGRRGPGSGPRQEPPRGNRPEPPRGPQGPPRK